MNKKIMIVDDEKDFCLLLKDYLVRKNYAVYITNTLNEAQSQVKTIIPDIIFIDNNLPDGAGWNFGCQILNDHPGIFMIFISAFNFQLPKLPVGAQFTVLEKPVSMSALDAHFKKQELQII